MSDWCSDVCSSYLRIERGLDAAIGAGEGLPAYLARRTAWRDAVKLRWDWLNARWNGLVLGYGPELQQQFLERFGLGDMRSMILALTVLLTGGLSIVGLFLLRRRIHRIVRCVKDRKSTRLNSSH